MLRINRKMDYLFRSSIWYSKYITNRYLNKAVIMTHPNGSKFFRTHPYDKTVEDPIVRNFMKFNYYTLIDFHKKLSSQVKKYGLERSIIIPYFGNLIVGHPYFILSSSNDSILLGQVADIIQLETRPAIPPKERAIIAYKIGWAMSHLPTTIGSFCVRFLFCQSFLPVAASYAASTPKTTTPSAYTRWP